MTTQEPNTLNENMSSESEIVPKKVRDTPPDVVLLCGGERISCHRAVLAKASSYFNAMFSSNFSEKDEPLITIQVCYFSVHYISSCLNN